MADVSTQVRRPGRPRRTEDQAQAIYAQRKEKYWGPERNAARREKYATDAAYAEQLRQTRRENYRASRGVVAENPSCIGNLPRVHAEGRLGLVSAYGISATKLVYHPDIVATLVDRAPSIMYRWQTRGIFPRPVLVGANGGLFYGEAEVEAFVRILGEHQRRTPHYRIDHTDTKEALFAAAFDNDPIRTKAWLQEL